MVRKGTIKNFGEPSQWLKWRRNNLERARDMTRKSEHRYYQKHKDAINQKAREYYKLHRREKVDYQLEWSRQHPEGRLSRQEKIKIKVFKHYSPNLTCQKCGFSDIRALSMDHINGGGRRQGLFGANLYHWIERNNFPTTFQVLCMNCQRIKQFENKEWAKKRG